MSAAIHPRLALFGSNESAPLLPVCDHYSGVEVRMRKSLQLQAEMGPVFDVTLDAEDGAPVGGEVEHAHLIASLIDSDLNLHGRVGARVLPVDHARFGDVLETVLKGQRSPAYVMLPKPRNYAEVVQAAQALDGAGGAQVPLHVLVETHGALRDVFQIAAHPRIESISFGLMDFVSAHRGAIPQSGMSVTGQFEHPLVIRAKLEISAACHAHAKTPSHCVVTEFKDRRALEAAALRASRQLGYTRMWSIHPDQIVPIVEAFAPSTAEVDQAIEILLAAQAAGWAPINHRAGHRDTLHDRASYRYFWHVLERAHRTGQPLPAEIQQAFFSDTKP